jgi:tRNA A-37 threonylcarbamoyl transferase component Bud32
MEGVRLGRYRLGRRLATGGMAEVFAATVEGAAGFEKPVAIKRILPHLCEDPEFVEMFREEARMASRLTHANIAQVFDFDEIDGQYLLAMEWVHGKDLRRVLRAAEKRSLPPSPGRAIHLVREVARALHHAHTAAGPGGPPLGLVHRDVSPQNILVSFAGEVKLTDFGIAKAASRSVATGVGIIKGKAAYMSPEQARGEPLDARSDVFALGIVLWEALTGRRLFTGDSDTEILRAVQLQAVVAPSAIRGDVPAALDPVVLRALEKERDARHESAAAFEAALTDVLLRHATGARDLDLSAWMASLFPEEIGDILGGRASEDLGLPPSPRRGGTAAAVPTPPAPREAGTVSQRPVRRRAEATAELPAPEAVPRRRRGGMLAVGAGLLAMAAAAIVLGWVGAPRADGTRGADPGAATEAGTAPATMPASSAGAPDRPVPGEETDPSLATGDAGDAAGAAAEDAGAIMAGASGEATARAEVETEAPPDGPVRPRRAQTRRPPREAAARRAAPGPEPTAEPAPTAAPASASASASADAPAPASADAPAPAPGWAGGTAVLAAPGAARPSAAPPAPGPAIVPAGTRLEGRLALGVDTESAPIAEARLTRSFVDGGEVRLPRDTRLMGTATAAGDRVILRFDRLIPPGGPSRPVRAAAYGRDGRPGLDALDGLTGGESAGLTLSRGTEMTVVLEADLVLD